MRDSNEKVSNPTIVSPENPALLGASNLEMDQGDPETGKMDEGIKRRGAPDADNDGNVEGAEGALRFWVVDCDSDAFSNSRERSCTAQEFSE